MRFVRAGDFRKNIYAKMGNQITATAPAQILPVESYFSELTEYTKTSRLVASSELVTT